MLNDALIEQILSSAPANTIGVFGDLFLDRYLDIDGQLTERSIETGLDAYQVTRVRPYPGAAGTVINNLVALGIGRVIPISVIGDDGEGYELRQALQRLPGVELGSVLVSPERRTPTYTKPMLREPGKLARELNRIDIRNRKPTPADLEESMIGQLVGLWERCDALIVLDQVSEIDCGVITRNIRARICKLAEADPGQFVLADSREQIGEFRGVCLKPNRSECARATGLSPEEWVLGASRLAVRGNRTVFATGSEEGMHLVEPTGAPPTHVPAYPVEGPIDPVGAGDSCSAGIAVAVAAGASLAQAAAFGNLIASITVQQIGVTGTAPPDLVRARWRELDE